MSQLHDETFISRQKREPSTFEKKYLASQKSNDDSRVGLPGLSPQLVEKQKEMEKTNEDLDAARAKFEAWQVIREKQKIEIEKKQKELEKQKQSLDQFTLHYSAELEKAKKREAEEKEMTRQIDRDLIDLVKEEDVLKKTNDSLKKELEELQPCADYLQNVVESCQTFDNIDAILTRHQTLAKTREEYLQKYKSLMERLGNDETSLSKQLAVHQSHLIDSTMKFNLSLSKVSQAKKQNEYRKTNIMKEVQRLDEKNVDLASIRASIRNIYYRALERSGSRAQVLSKKEDVTEEQMLQYIVNRFNDLRDIINDPNVVYENTIPPKK